MNYTDIDNSLHKLFIASLHYQSVMDRYRRHNALDSITYYVNTGRASTPWLKAFCKADKEKLMNRMAKAAEKDGTTVGDIKTATAYLKRYCGYEC